ncbi:MAG: glycosyltransferase family 2 protein [Muribaculaceae bacterium]|nr:glycosyltransferase family 2 protein [Muribaculaceae bacterium]
MKKDVSVIIVNYNTKGLLRDCITSIRKNTHYVDYEIIVVDNASSDGSIDMLKQDFPDVIAVDAGGNLGFGRANNIGMKTASGKYLFLLNSDTLLLNNAIKEFYDNAERLLTEGYRIGAMGAILLDRNHDTCHSYGHFITPAGELKELMTKYFRFLKDHSNTNPSRIKDNLDVDYITGADMFIPAEVFHQTGGFDPDFFMYCEEVDWQKRMEEAGLRRIVIAGPEIIHLEGGSEKGSSNYWSPNRLVNLYTSRKIYRKKHYNKMMLPVFRVMYFLLDIPALLGISLLSRRKAYLRLINLK